MSSRQDLRKTGCGRSLRFCRNFLVGLYIGIAVLFVSCHQQARTSSSNAEKLAVGELVRTSPEELGKLLKSQPSDFTVINVWATWCPPCVHEIPEFVRFYQSADKTKVRLISVVVMSDPDGAVKALMEKHQVPFPVYFAAIGSPDELVYVLGLETSWDGALPATFVLNKELKMVKEWFEEITADELLKTIESTAN
ncbi:MAG TPA: TlpA family protein disulfide reductase [Candidatus Hydrogenedentes bacterium]|nr:TlpA family protein disulfide reductase [Candidatus Hydrogenedentota bacterium]HOL75899.1 TlpA family protein disulfide reductase [Candidatus Hydrogenedentota bacterium]HPO85692.1 TlpA family protein disulfide reductase [Candidatus Hydrogenedentota bacterium]